MVQLPPEVYGVIASYVNTRDLLTLARTTKALQRAAEPRIYESVMFRDAQTAYHGCHALTLRDGLRALYVKRFVLYQDPRRASARNNLTAVPAQFWLTIQLALTLAVNLDTLVLWDPLAVHSWVLDHEQIRFQLREANLRLPWDAHLVAFLEKQDKLQALNACDGPGDDDDGGGGPLCPLPPTALGALESFSGPVLVVAELFGCPLTRVQIFLDDDTAPILPTVAGDLGRIMKGLRSLSVVNLPAGLLLETVQLVSTSVFASTIRYLGVLPLSSTEVSCPSPRSRSRPCFSGYSYLDAVHRVDAASPRSGPGRLELESVNSNSRARATRTRKLVPPHSVPHSAKRTCSLTYVSAFPSQPDALNVCLMNLPALEVLEVDLTRWEPQPPEWMHRPLLLGFRIFAPSLQQVIFWVGSTRVSWYLPSGQDSEWQSVRHMGRVPGNDNFWRSF